MRWAASVSSRAFASFARTHLFAPICSAVGTARIKQAAGVILHVDHEGVDLGLIGEAHELPQFRGSERPCVHVQRLDVRRGRSEEHTSELQSQSNLVCRLLLEKKKKKI